VDGRISQIIVDKNGHSKTVWVSLDKGSATLAATRNRIPVSAPPSGKTSGNKVTSSDIERWIDRNELPLSGDEDFVDLVNATIVASGKYSDSSFQAAYDQVFHDNFGGYSVDSLRAALAVEHSQSDSDSSPLVVNSNDYRVRAGEVFDQVEYDGITYNRSRDGVYPTDVYSMRFQFSRELNEDEAKLARDLIAYAWASRIRGEQLSDEDQDTPFSIVIGGDSTKSRSDDTGFALSQWEDMVREYISEGTKQKDESLRIPPVDPGLTVEIYYDNVAGD